MLQTIFSDEYRHGTLILKRIWINSDFQLRDQFAGSWGLGPKPEKDILNQFQMMAIDFTEIKSILTYLED